MTKYLFILHVECPDGKQYTHTINVNAFEAPQFDRYDLCSEPLSAMMAGVVMSMGALAIHSSSRAAGTIVFQ